MKESNMENLNLNVIPVLHSYGIRSGDYQKF